MTLMFALVAFLGGAVSITSPCTLPILPPFLVYIAAANSKDRQHKLQNVFVRSIARSALFMLGVLIVFALSANQASGISQFAGEYKELIILVSGFYILGLGISLVRGGGRQKKKRTKIGAALTFLAGLSFGFIAIPCCLGRVISGILMTGAAVDRNLLLLSYILGLGLVFVVSGLITSVLVGRLFQSKESLEKLIHYAGWFLIVIGVLVVSGLWSEWIFDLQRYSAANKLLPVRLEEQLLEAFGVAL